MKRMNIFLVLVIFSMSGCLSLGDAGRAYFSSNKKYAGVEDYQHVKARIDKNKSISNIIYKNFNIFNIKECMLLRNQIYVASLLSLNSDDTKEIKLAVDTLERAYQQDDQAFLISCEQVFKTRVGRIFRDIQAYYSHR